MLKVSEDSKDQPTSTVRNLRETLANNRLMLMFRQFLRTKIDSNKSDDPDKKKTSEQWLDFVIICENVFEQPEDQTELKINLMVEIGEKFLENPPAGYNMALQNQLNRKELVCHCHNLSKGTIQKPDDSLLRSGYEYVYGKLDQEHDLFRKTFKPTIRST